MSSAETPHPEFELVVAQDGSIPADELKRLGIKPGAHLRVVEETKASRKKLRGILKGLIDVEAIDQGLREAKAERIAAIEREDEQ